MRDVQGDADYRRVPIKQVGIRKLRWPVILKDKVKGTQASVATVSMAVDLPHEIRGTHMSRFVESLQTLEAVYPEALEKVLDSLKERLEAKSAFLTLEFPYFITKEAPVSGQKSLLDVDCTYRVEKTETLTLQLKVAVPIHTLCPCSKEISQYGAHNQRATATIEVETTGFVWIEELVELAESGGSSAIYPLLKRPDEKWVTEKAYENPRFVEDAAREIALQLDNHPRIARYRVSVDSIESIHNHNAFACVEKDWKGAAY